MNHKIALLTFASVLLIAAITASNNVMQAQSGSGYELSWSTIDGGGAQELAGGTYTLSGTIGQYDAGLQGGGTYTLSGGFWFDPFGYTIYLPIILR